MNRQRPTGRRRPGRLGRGRRAAAERGRLVAQAVRRAATRRVALWLRSQDPKVLTDLAEVGLVNRDWLEGTGPTFSDAAPLTVVTRALEALVERRPSTLSTLGLSTLQVLAAASGDHAGGNPRRMSVVFADLRGFTAFTAQHGDEAARQVLHDYYVTAGRVVRSRGGRIVKRLGDGLLVTFDDATPAVLAAAELVGYTPDHRPTQGAAPDDLAVRAGIDTGDVLVDADDIAGHTVNVASRVTDVATAGEVLVTEQTAADVAADDSRFSVEPAAPVVLRGLADPVPLHRVTLRTG